MNREETKRRRIRRRVFTVGAILLAAPPLAIAGWWLVRYQPLQTVDELSGSAPLVD